MVDVHVRERQPKVALFVPAGVAVECGISCRGQGRTRVCGHGNVRATWVAIEVGLPQKGHGGPMFGTGIEVSFHPR